MSDPVPWEKRQTYPALCSPGFTSVSITELEAFFLDKVDTPPRRRLISELRNFIMKLKSLGVMGDLWVNGSFSTMNPNPHDYDVLLVIPQATLLGLGETELIELEQLTDPTNRAYVKRKWSCDLYTCNSSHIGMQSHYKRLFSKNPDENTKGIPVISI